VVLNKTNLMTIVIQSYNGKPLDWQETKNKKVYLCACLLLRKGSNSIVSPNLLARYSYATDLGAYHLHPCWEAQWQIHLL
jgi:hypothetical protein